MGLLNPEKAFSSLWFKLKVKWSSFELSAVETVNSLGTLIPLDAVGLEDAAGKADIN